MYLTYVPYLPSKNMEIGSGTKRLVSGLPDDKQKTLRLEFRKSLKLVGKYMKECLPLTNAVLRDLQCLHPLYRKEKGGRARRAAIDRLCNHLKKVTKTDEFSDAVCAELLLYASDSALDNETSKFDYLTSCNWCLCIRKMGRAVYVADRFDLAIKFAIPDPSGLRSVFVCRAVVGIPAVVTTKMKLHQPPFYDRAHLIRCTCVKDAFISPKAYAFFNERQIIPEYVVKFRM